MVLKVTLEKKSLILINIYRRPDNEEASMRLTALIERINVTYIDTPIIIFGDFNYKRNEIKKRFDKLLKVDFEFVYDDDPEMYTRSQLVNGKMQQSYLDYILVKNVTGFNLTIHNPIGNSDHRCLGLYLYQNDMRIERRDIKEIKFSLINGKHKDIGERLLKCLKEPDRITKCCDLVNTLRFEFPKMKVKLKSHFKIAEKINTTKDWGSFKSILKKCSSESYCQFMNNFEKLKLNRKWKEYFAKLRFYSDLNKDVDILSNLSITIPDFGDTVTIDKDTINKKVSEKYRKLFKDDGTKLLIKPINDEVLIYTDDMIKRALDKLNLNKATSWDLLPGKSFEIFKEKENLPYLTRFINEIMSMEIIPDNLTLGRLLCLNKNANEPGHIDSIRPIVILGVIIKICEFPLLEALRKVKLHLNQTGFLRGMGCEINILRFRQLVHNLNYNEWSRKVKMKKRYLLFIDLKCAFDSVPLIKLIKKLQAKKVPANIINGLIQLMNCSKISPDMEEMILINGGVAQGKLCSPLLFNIYFDDLIEILNNACYSALAYADDLVLLCRGQEELTKAVQILREWCIKNDITINEKKSGIIILNADGTDAVVLLGFPVVQEYKYLGVTINSNISAIPHVHAQKSKVDNYLKKNSMLLKKYFTPFSLIRIVDYFVKSRMSYGLCCFLDSPALMKQVDKTLTRHLISIFGLPQNTKHKLLRLVIGEPRIQTRLAMRLINNWHKHKYHFKEENHPIMYEKTLLEYFSKDDIYLTNGDYKDFKCKHWTMKASMFTKDLREYSRELLDIDVRHDHSGYLKKYVFTYPDLRNFYIIRYFSRTSKGTATRLYPICGSCGQPNTPQHGANDCPEQLNNRDDIVQKIENIFVRNDIKTEDNLYDYLQAIYFTIDGLKAKDRNKLIETMKNTIVNLIKNDKSINILSVRDEEIRSQIDLDNEEETVLKKLNKDLDDLDEIKF